MCKFTFLAALCVGSILSAYAQKQVGETVLNENFEGVKSAEALVKIKPDAAKLSLAKADEAIDGKVSLRLDSTANKGKWLVGANIFQDEPLKSDSIYTVEFKYRIEELNSPSGQFFLSIVDKDDKHNFYGRIPLRTFSEKEGNAKVIGIVPRGANPALVRISSTEGGTIVIDNLKVMRAPMIDNAWIFEKDAFYSMRKSPVHPNIFDPSNPAYSLPREKFFPIVDKYGQYKHADWVGKIHSEKELLDSIEFERQETEKLATITNRDAFGGLADSADGAQKTAGFTVAKVNGKWFLRDPLGNLFWSHGIDCVGEFAATPIDRREHYFEEIDPKYLHKSNGSINEYRDQTPQVYEIGAKIVERKYAISKKDYGKIAEARMKSWGLNTYGAWTKDFVYARNTTPFTCVLGSGKKVFLDSKHKLTGHWSKPADYFDPEFEKSTIAKFKKVQSALNQEMCIGAFVDNELPWQGTVGEIPKAVLSCPATQPAKLAMRDMLKNKYTTIENLNSSWGSSYTSWDDFLVQRDFLPDLKKSCGAPSDMSNFEETYYHKYFQACRAGVKLASPKALYLGCRFAWKNPLVERIAYQYCDVVSYNIYSTTPRDFKIPEGVKDKPVIIGEFHIARIDKGSPYGGLLEVNNAAEAEAAYVNYMNGAVLNPHIVGAHWFQWGDLCITGRIDNANATCGFVSVCDVPDFCMVRAANTVAKDLYQKRLAQGKSPEKK